MSKTLTRRPLIERFNSGTLRRYHFTGGATLVCITRRSPLVIPRFCPHVTADIKRSEAAAQLRLERATRGRK